MKSSNPVVYFEIPVHDLARAEKFYSAVFNFSFEKEIIDRYEMALFPFEEKNSGITGALAKGDVYKPSKNGVIIYFKSENIDQTLEKVLQQGGSVLYPKRIDEKYGFAVAEFEDSEGNRIALHETVK
ncbi:MULTISPECIES: VOC family protein [unclassified Chryseobacterium]|uniref:VOC family protein n=1 Tax=unclassified Chryseobacterium TaxID=2593645 RepID=UPI0028535F5B|nr:VOC family protein [Chryseobacterium sp. CFS7]MDR4893190.1 VOC family protein [Chryseobacterium sp. CFS7]